MRQGISRNEKKRNDGYELLVLSIAGYPTSASRHHYGDSTAQTPAIETVEKVGESSAKFKPCNEDQLVMLPISLQDQLVLGTLEHIISQLVDKDIDPIGL